MFRHLTDFAYQRSFVQAIGFYLFYFLIAILLGGLFGGVAGLLSPGTGFSTSFDKGATIGNLVAVGFDIVLALVVLVRKDQAGHPGYLILAILSGILALFIGGLGGTIVPAFLSTRPKRSSVSIPERGQ